MYFLSHFTLKTTNADNSNKTKTERKQLEKKINHKTKLVSEHIIILQCITHYYRHGSFTLIKKRKKFVCVNLKRTVHQRKKNEEGSRRNKQNKMYLHLLLISWMTLQL